MITKALKICIFFWLLFPILCEAQIKISDFSQAEDDRTEKYDSSYFQPNYRFDNLSVMNGLVRHNLIFLDEPMSNYDCKIFQNGIQQESFGAFKKYLFQNCKIEKVINGSFYLSCMGDSIMYKPSSLDAQRIIIAEGFEKFKSKHMGKKYYSLSTLKFLSLDSKDIDIVQGQVLILESIEVVKLSTQFGLGFKFSSQDQNFTIALTFFDGYLEHGGNPKGKIDFVFFDKSVELLRIVDEILYSAINKSLFKKNILKGEVVVGMTEKEIRIVWGMPTRDKMSAGYDKIMIYEAGGTTYYLYMKGKKLVRISQI